MYEFTESTWDADTERYRQRIAKMTDERLVREIEAGIFLTRPDRRPPRESFVIQYNLDRLEAMRRLSRMTAPWDVE